MFAAMFVRGFTLTFCGFCLCRATAASLTSVHAKRDVVHTEPSVEKGIAANLRVTPPPPKDMFMDLASRVILPAKKKLKLEIHYETLCPYCSSLIGTELKSIWNDTEFRERLDVSMFPAGNVKVFPVEGLSKGWRAFHPELVKDGFGHVFMCQHGEEECLGNMIQACAMTMLGEPADYLPFMFCMESAAAKDESVESAAFRCVKETTTLDAEDLVKCTQSPEANKKMFSIATYSDSLSPPRQHAPWVVINGEHHEKADNGDLLGSLCSALAAPLPAACKGMDNEHSQGILSQVGHWLGAVQLSSTHHRQRGSTHARVCYP